MNPLTPAIEKLVGLLPELKQMYEYETSYGRHYVELTDGELEIIIAAAKELAAMGETHVWAKKDFTEEELEIIFPGPSKMNQHPIAERLHKSANLDRLAEYKKMIGAAP